MLDQARLHHHHHHHHHDELEAIMAFPDILLCHLERCWSIKSEHYKAVFSQNLISSQMSECICVPGDPA